jgi:hypothetical protein
VWRAGQLDSKLARRGLLKPGLGRATRGLGRLVGGPRLDASKTV